MSVAFFNGTRAVGGGAGVEVGDMARSGVDVGDGCLAGVDALWDKTIISWLEAVFKEQRGDGGGLS